MTKREAHPLFPARSEDDEAPEVCSIHVTRPGEGWHVFPFKPEELTELSQIYERFGGGRYELIARNDRHITDRRPYTLPGPSKPLNDGAQSPGAQPEAPAATSAPPQYPMQAAPGMSEQMLLALMKMMSDQQNNSTQVLVAMMNGSREAQSAHLENMQRLHDRHAESSMKMMQTIMESSKRADGGGAEAYDRGIKTALDLAERLRETEPDDSDDDDDDIMGQLVGTLSSLAQGAGMATQPGNGQSAPPMAPPEGPPTTVDPEELS